MGDLPGRGGLVVSEGVGDDRCSRVEHELARRGDAGFAQRQAKGR